MNCFYVTVKVYGIIQEFVLSEVPLKFQFRNELAVVQYLSSNSLVQGAPLKGSVPSRPFAECCHSQGWTDLLRR
jgi:hypothetical protein